MDETDYLLELHDACMSDDPEIALRGRVMKTMYTTTVRVLEDENARGTESAELIETLIDTHASLIFGFTAMHIKNTREHEKIVSALKGMFCTTLDHCLVSWKKEMGL